MQRERETVGGAECWCEWVWCGVRILHGRRGNNGWTWLRVLLERYFHGFVIGAPFFHFSLLMRVFEFTDTYTDIHYTHIILLFYSLKLGVKKVCGCVYHHSFELSFWFIIKLLIINYRSHPCQSTILSTKTILDKGLVPINNLLLSTDVQVKNN